MFKCVYGTHKTTYIYAYIYVCMFIYIYILYFYFSYVCVLFITGYYTDEQVYQVIDTVQCKRVYLSAKGVSTQQVPLLGTVLLVNECICVFCAEVFLLLVGFF